MHGVQRECVARRHDVCIANVWAAVDCVDCSRPAAASCAAGYAWGEDGSNRCPASFFAIINAVVCETAATAAGKAYIGRVTEPNSPSGCYLNRGINGVYFNADADGAGRPFARLLCSGAARSRTAGLSTIG